MLFSRYQLKANLPVSTSSLLEPYRDLLSNRSSSLTLHIAHIDLHLFMRFNYTHYFKEHVCYTCHVDSLFILVSNFQALEQTGPTHRNHAANPRLTHSLNDLPDIYICNHLSPVFSNKQSYILC